MNIRSLLTVASILLLNGQLSNSLFAQNRIADLRIDYQAVNKKNEFGKQGKWVIGNADGNIFEVVNYVDGALSGSYLHYWSNGNLAEKGNYANGKLQGRFIAYWEDGSSVRGKQAIKMASWMVLLLRIARLET